MKLEEYNVENTTHYLKCRHCVNSNSCYEYLMKCIYLGKTKSGKVKIVVFGDRAYANKDHLKRIRYVDETNLTKLLK